MLHWIKCVAVGKLYRLPLPKAPLLLLLRPLLHLAQNTPFIPLISCTLAAAFGQANLHKYFTHTAREGTTEKLLGTPNCSYLRVLLISEDCACFFLLFCALLFWLFKRRTKETGA